MKVHTERQAKLLKGSLGEAGSADVAVAWAMRYGQPSIANSLDQFKRDGVERKVQVKPERTEGKTIFGEPMPIYVIGVGPSEQVVTERSNPIMAIWQGLAKTVELSWLTFMTLVKLFQAIVPASNLGGPIMIMKMAGEQAHQGLSSLLFFMAILSINLGVLNLLPILPLDGGRIRLQRLDLAAERGDLAGEPLVVAKRVRTK